MRKTARKSSPNAKACCPPDVKLAPLVMDEAAEAHLAALSRALSHPARIRILRVLLERDVCIAGELADVVPLAASTVSQHLAILKESGLIKGEVDGPRRCYCADKAVVARFQSLVAKL